MRTFLVRTYNEHFYMTQGVVSVNSKSVSEAVVAIAKYFGGRPSSDGWKIALPRSLFADGWFSKPPLSLWIDSDSDCIDIFLAEVPGADIGGKNIFERIIKAFGF